MREKKRDVATIRTGVWLSTERYVSAGAAGGVAATIFVSVTFSCKPWSRAEHNVE